MKCLEICIFAVIEDGISNFLKYNQNEKRRNLRITNNAIIQKGRSYNVI